MSLRTKGLEKYLTQKVAIPDSFFCNQPIIIIIIIVIIITTIIIIITFIQYMKQVKNCKSHKNRLFKPGRKTNKLINVDKYI